MILIHFMHCMTLIHVRVAIQIAERIPNCWMHFTLLNTWHMRQIKCHVFSNADSNTYNNAYTNSYLHWYPHYWMHGKLFEVHNCPHCYPHYTLLGACNTELGGIAWKFETFSPSFPHNMSTKNSWSMPFCMGLFQDFAHPLPPGYTCMYSI